MGWGSFLGGLVGGAVGLATGGVATPFLTSAGAGLGGLIEGATSEDAEETAHQQQKAASALELHQSLDRGASEPHNYSPTPGPVPMPAGQTDEERRQEQERKRQAALGMLGGGAYYA